jgi:hypothetical protein
VVIVHPRRTWRPGTRASRREDVLDTIIKLTRSTEEPAGELRVMVGFEKTRGFTGPDAESFELALTTDETRAAVWTVNTRDGGAR